MSSTTSALYKADIERLLEHGTKRQIRRRITSLCNLLRNYRHFFDWPALCSSIEQDIARLTTRLNSMQ